MEIGVPSRTTTPVGLNIHRARRIKPHQHLQLAMIMSEQTKPGEPVDAPATSAVEQVPDWLGNRLKRMFTEVMDEPVPDEFKALLKQLEEKERGS
jgi:hypothetical protein